MRRHSSTYQLFVTLLCVLALTQLFAVFFSLYWVYLWLDIPMHALGGAVVALGYLSLAERFAFSRAARGLGVTLLATLCIGLGWEAYELATGAFFQDVAPLGDTALDVLMDLFGGAAAYALAEYVRGRES